MACSRLLVLSLLPPLLCCQGARDAPPRALDEVDRGLGAGTLSQQDVLTDPAWRPLLDAPETRSEVRQLLTEHPAEGRLQMVGADQAGTPLHVEATFVDRAGEPIPGLRIHLSQAAADGRYAPEADGPGEGEGNARLFAWLRSDADGRIALDTILPGAYGGAPPHFHMTLLPPGAPPADRLHRRLYFDPGQEAVHPEIRSDAAEGVAWLVPLEAGAGEQAASATCRLPVVGR